MKRLLAYILVPAALLSATIELTEEQIAAGIKVRESTMAAARKQFPGMKLPQMINFYEEHAPDMLDEWRRRCTYQPETAQAYLNMLSERYVKINAMRKAAPENYEYNIRQLKTEMEIRQLSFKIRAAQQENKTAAEIFELKMKLAELLENNFDETQQRQLQEVSRLENELKYLKARVDDRARNRDYAIQQKFIILTGQKWPK